MLYASLPYVMSAALPGITSTPDAVSSPSIFKIFGIFSIVLFASQPDATHRMAKIWMIYLSLRCFPHDYDLRFRCLTRHCLSPCQMFTYPSISPFSAISGVISPTTFSLMASPVVTPRTTPRTTPIPRWSTPFIPLDESPDYSMMVSLVSGTNSDESLQDGE